MRNTFHDQSAIADYATKRFRDQLQLTGRIVAEVDVESLIRPRPQGTWSIAGFFDHMAVMNSLYIGKIEHAIDVAPTSSHRDWRPTLAGRTLRWAVNTRLKIPTVAIFVPADPSSDPAAIQRFETSIRELTAVLERSWAMHWKSVRVSSPASDLIKLNLGDVFLVLAEHTDRHLRQIDEHLHPRRTFQAYIPDASRHGDRV